MNQVDVYIKDCRDQIRALYQAQFSIVGNYSRMAKKFRRANQLEIKELVEDIELAESSLIRNILRGEIGRAVFTADCHQGGTRSISRTELAKKLAEMWADNLITYDELKAVLKARG